MNKLINKIAKIFKDKGRTFVVKNADGEPDTRAEILVPGNIDFVPKVSVIIPVYNVEMYLRECLDSVINQTLKEIEIICVDDGSTDNSLQILKEYAKCDNRITIVTQDNLHAGVARNAGLAIAKGEYLSFLDSDDFFEPDMLEKAYTNAVQNSSDVVMFNLYLYDDTTKENKEVEWTLNIKDVPAVFNYKDIPDRIFKLSNCWVWNRLYNHEFIKNNNLHFQNLGCANDTYFSCIATVLAQRITYVDSRLVHYRTNRQQFQNVTSVSFRHKHPTDLLKCFYTVYKKLKEMKVYDAVKYSYLMVATEHICWSEQAFLNDDDLYKKFTTYFADNYNDVYKDKSPFTNNTLNKKYIKLRNILVDAGVFKEIPKRIFYVWGANESIRPEVQKCIDTWERYLPDYDIVQINDESTRYFNFKKELEQNKWFKTVYERKMWAYVADYVRVKTLYDNGGIYFDTDVSVVQNMDKFLQDPAFVGIQRSSLDGTGDWVEPAICGAQKHNKFFANVVSFYDELIWKEPIFTMPHLFNYYLRKHDIFPFPKKSEQKIIKLPDITIYPERYFIPYRWNTEFKPECIEPDTHTIHHWGGSWTKPEVQWFLKNKHLPPIKVSVIVCVYNDAKYVSECLESLLNQTLKEIEIICVNDGSTDDSLQIIEKFAQKDSRITVINQKNSGLATSRNNALKIIRGEYCGFVDSDDYIAKDALEKLYYRATKDNLDMLGFSGYNFDNDNKCIENKYWNFSYLPNNWNKNVFSYKDCLGFMHKMAVSSCLTMYKTEFILKNRLKFPDGLVYEDNIFWTTAFTKDARFGILNEKFYKRRLHNASITHNWQNNLGDWIKINDMLLEYLKSINIDQRTFEAYRQVRSSDILTRFNRLDDNGKANLKPQVDAFLEKYKQVEIEQFETLENKVVAKRFDIKLYLLFLWYLFKVKMKTKEYNDLLAKQIINDIRKYRIDIRYVDEPGDMNIVGNVQVITPGWIKGYGHVISDIKPVIHFDITTYRNGRLALYFRGHDYSKDGKREPVYIKYKSIKIDGKDVITKPVVAWHDSPFTYELDVKNNQNISVDVEVSDYDYSDHEYFCVSRLVHPGSSLKESDFIKCAKKILKLSDVPYEKLQRLPVIESDVFIPLGTACRPAYWLKEAGLRKYTLPFDWMMNYGLDLVIDTLKDRKKEWFLDFTETPATNELHHSVKDNTSGMISLHHFPQEYPVREYLPMFNIVFNRRKERFYNVIKNNQTICFIANRKEGVIDILRFMKNVKNMFENKKVIFIQIKHTCLDNDIIKYELDTNCVLYDVHCNDINEKDSKDLIGNVELWTGLTSHLNLNPKAKDVQDKDTNLDMQIKEISAQINLLNYKQKESIDKLNKGVCDTKQQMNVIISEQKNMMNNIEKVADELNNQMIGQQKIFDARFVETGDKLTKIQDDFIDNVNRLEQSLESNINNAINDIVSDIDVVFDKVESGIDTKILETKSRLVEIQNDLSQQFKSDISEKYLQLSNKIQNISDVNIKHISDLNKNINNVVTVHNNSLRSLISKTADKFVSNVDSKYSQLSSKIQNSLTSNSNDFKELDRNMNCIVNNCYSDLKSLMYKNTDKIVADLDTKYGKLNQNIELVSDKIISDSDTKYSQLSDDIENFVDDNMDNIAEMKEQIQNIDKSVSISEEHIKDSVRKAQDNLQSLTSKNADKFMSNIDIKHNDLKRNIQSVANKYASDLDKLYKKTTDVITQNSDVVAEKYAELQESIKQNEKLYNNLSRDVSNIAAQQNENNNAVVDVQNRISNLETNTKTLFKQNSEPYWANVYHDTINNSQWLNNKSVSPGRWAVSYIVLYVLYRVLDEIKPQSVLECGLGQSSKLTIQYADSHKANLMICENNPEWLSFFQRQFPTADKYTKILNTKMVHIVPEHESRTYAEFELAIQNKKFNLVLVDGPLGSAHYSRPEILDVVDNLDKSFVIMLDDMNRIGEQEIWGLLKQKLKDKGIEFVDTVYASDKSVGLLCSPDLAYLTTL